MKIYSLEQEIKDKIINDTKATAIAVIDAPELSYAVNSENNSNLVSALRNDLSINKGSFFVPAILVTTNWNRNDDIFSPEETAKARNTPINKPISWMHKNNEDDNEILGVIVSCIAVNDNYEILDANIDLASLEKFHLAVGGLVWERYFPTYSEDIESGLKNKDLFVSMEAIFDDFGYGLRENASADIILVERNEKNSGLTKFLRKFGGPGKIQINGKNYQIGRWLKQITFSGMGFVDNPGNLESVLLSPDLIRANQTFACVDSDIQKFIENSENCVLTLENLNNIESLSMAKEIKKDENLVVATDDKDTDDMEMAKKMKDMECAHTEAMNKALAEVEALKASLASAESEAKAMKDKLTSAETEAAKAKADAEAAAKALSEVESKFNATKAEFDTTAKELGDIKRKAKAVERFAELKSFNAAVDGDDAALATLADMTDDTYASVKNFAEAAFKKTTEMTKSSFPKATDQSQTGNTKLTQALEDVKADDTKADIDNVVAAAAGNITKTDDVTLNLSKLFGNMMVNSKKNTKKSV